MPGKPGNDIATTSANRSWTAIRLDDMKAINLPHFKMRLRDLSRELYIEHSWQMPVGLVRSEERNPLNYTLQEWQQAKRVGRDPERIKEAFQDAWAISDCGASFRNALEARGYYLARGDRRGFVALDITGEVYAIARWTGARTKNVAARLGDPDRLPTLEAVRQSLAARILDKVAAFAIETRQQFEVARLALRERRRALVSWQRDERQFLTELHAARWVQETRERLARFRSGLKGLWDRITGRHGAIRRQNELECERATMRDRAERQALVERQLTERRELQNQVKREQDRLQREMEALRVPVARPQVRAESRVRKRGPRLSL